MATEDDPAATRLSASSAVILGLLASFGPQTTYDMKGLIEYSIGFFWPFPSSQMYAEAKRLETAGLVRGEQEEHGRKRRVLHLTAAGQAALDTWQAEPTDRPTEIRDIGLLKLALSGGSTGRDVRELAAEQVEHHRARLAEYEQIRATFSGDLSNFERTIELGLAYERVAIDFWQSAADAQP